MRRGALAAIVLCALVGLALLAFLKAEETVARTLRLERTEYLRS